MGRRAGLMDAPRLRFSVALLIAFGLWAVLLTRFVNPLLRPLPSAAAPVQATMEMRHVELAAPPPDTRAVAPSTPPAPVTPQVHARRDPTPARVARPHEIQRPTQEHLIAKTDQPAPAASSSATSTAAVTASSSSASPSNAAA